MPRKSLWSFQKDEELLRCVDHGLSFEEMAFSFGMEVSAIKRRVNAIAKKDAALSSGKENLKNASPETIKRLYKSKSYADHEIGVTERREEMLRERLHHDWRWRPNNRAGASSGCSSALNWV